jgi:hypothetical protein
LWGRRKKGESVRGKRGIGTWKPLDCAGKEELRLKREKRE